MGITDWIETIKGPLVSTYEYNSELSARRGSVSLGIIKVDNLGTFGASYEEGLSSGVVISSEYEGVVIRDKDLKEVSKFTGWPSYKHVYLDNQVFSVGSAGGYQSICLVKGTSERQVMVCGSGKCQHEVWSVHVEGPLVYLGCDLGTMAIKDQRSNEWVQQMELGAGVTWLGRGEQSGVVEVGTYDGYLGLVKGTQEVDRKSLGGTVWRVFRREYQGRVLVIVARAYDGISIYSGDWQHLYTEKTDDLVYALRIDLPIITGFTYYLGTEVRLDLDKINLG
ncbi:hypothetical protein NEHOM01_1868 [Nematocida homosporus]|uniref:uncharacterized protein n=1 Tax=Nematocida homosporus TaxID=1912981 RepID=UPI00221E72CB|nr:uncharacterized protein NEHOM01_1868 [Nematocida homosporus]KAI5187016.1 hypothetical protein NEHOM01_1868 [Nematocida homosporus]